MGCRGSNLTYALAISCNADRQHHQRESAAEAIQLLKKATPIEMAISAYYVRAINELKAFLRWQQNHAPA